MREGAREHLQATVLGAVEHIARAWSEDHAEPVAGLAAAGAGERAGAPHLHTAYNTLRATFFGRIATVNLDAIGARGGDAQAVHRQSDRPHVRPATPSSEMSI
ncbi:MAG: hypothetical protein EBZ36_15280 [Acidobacteria bacterium]|nr:hypothetical protein [Acidobacteriota bacterium]